MDCTRVAPCKAKPSGTKQINASMGNGLPGNERMQNTIDKMVRKIRRPLLLKNFDIVLF